MGEDMAKVEITPGVIGPPEEEIQEIDKLAEEGKLKPERGLVPIFSPRVKAAMALAMGLGGTGCTGPLIAEVQRLIHPPAITEPAPVSAAQIPPASEILVVDKCKVEVVRDEVEKYDVNVEEVTDFLSSQGIGREASIELQLLNESFLEIWGGTHAREAVGCRHGKCEETHSYFIEFYMKDDLKDFVLPKEYGENVLRELEGVDAWNWAMAHSLYHIIEMEKAGEVESYPHHELTATQFANENFERPFFIEKEGSRK